MMADVKKRKALLVTYCLSVALLPSLLCTLTSWTEGCQDGRYEYEGNQCCKCPAGSKVKEHCTDQSETTCDECVTGMQYQSHATQQKTCEACTSCAQPNANLEVDRQCTAYLDSTCKCKENHYCPSGKTPCKICESCHVCGTEGEKVACSYNNNTICNDKPQDNTLGIALGLVIPLLLLLIVAVGVYCIRKKRTSGGNTLENGHVDSPEASVPLQTLAELPERLTPYIPEVAGVIGWPTMRNLAMKSKIHGSQIQGCEVNHPTDSEERTIALMRIWDQKKSKNAVPELIQHLKKTGQNSTVDDVLKILRGSS